MPETYVLYQYASCPFCARVNGFLDRLGIDIERRDTLRDADARRELLVGGGRSTVPCLRIESQDGVRWLYESLDIMRYLHERLVEPRDAG